MTTHILCLPTRYPIPSFVLPHAQRLAAHGLANVLFFPSQTVCSPLPGAGLSFGRASFAIMTPTAVRGNKRQFESVRRELLKKIANGLIECSNAHMLRWLLDIEALECSQGGAAQVQGLLECALAKASRSDRLPGTTTQGSSSEPHEIQVRICLRLLSSNNRSNAVQGLSSDRMKIFNDAISQVARGVCSSALRGSAKCSRGGAGPLGALDSSLLVDLAAAVLDNGWRYMTVEGVKPGLIRDWLSVISGWCLPCHASMVCCARKCGPRAITDDLAV